MNQKQLSYFLEVYRCRNIQAAADKLYLTHQGLSRVIRSLEEEFGSPLFTRTNRGLEPTDFATTLVPHVQRLLDDYATIQGVHTLTSQARSVVTIYALDHLFGYLGADLLLDFHRQRPEITLSILDTTDEYALESLSAGRGDFAVVNGPIDNTSRRRRCSIRASPSGCGGIILWRRRSICVSRILQARPFSARDAPTAASARTSTNSCSHRGCM